MDDMLQVEDVKKEISDFMQSQSVAREMTESDADMVRHGTPIFLSVFAMTPSVLGLFRSRASWRCRRSTGRSAVASIKSPSLQKWSSTRTRSPSRRRVCRGKYLRPWTVCDFILLSYVMICLLPMTSFNGLNDQNPAMVGRNMSTRRQSSTGLVAGTSKFGQVSGKIRQVPIAISRQRSLSIPRLCSKFEHSVGVRGFRPTPPSVLGITRFTHVVRTGKSPMKAMLLSSLCHAFQ